MCSAGDRRAYRLAALALSASSQALQRLHCQSHHLQHSATRLILRVLTTIILSTAFGAKTVLNDLQTDDHVEVPFWNLKVCLTLAGFVGAVMHKKNCHTKAAQTSAV